MAGTPARAPNIWAKARASSSTPSSIWREWADPGDHKREAVTFRARQVLFEGRRAAPAASGDESGLTRDSAAPSEPTEAPVGAGTVDGVGEAGADDLPF